MEQNNDEFIKHFHCILTESFEVPYVKQLLPSKIDEEIFRALQRISQQLSGEKTKVGFELTLKEVRRLRLFSERMSSLAVREKNIDRIIVGLFALVLNENWEDVREILLIIPLHFNSCKLIGVYPNDIFIRATELSSMKGKKLIIDFLNRKPEDQTIQCMGYAESKDESGFVYQRNW